nr:hypothetical protein [Tanacetum cinerariifolium]
MTLNEYLMYQGMHRDLERSCSSRNRIAYSKVAPVKNRILVYPDSDKEDEEYCRIPPLLPCFQTPQPCTKFNSISHYVKNEVDIDSITCDDKIVENTDHEDGGQKDGKLPDLPTFFVTNVSASVCEHVDENIEISITWEKEEVPMEDAEMDEDHDVDHSKTKEVLQWSLAKDPFLVFIEFKDQSHFVQQITLSSISNKVPTARGWESGSS